MTPRSPQVAAASTGRAASGRAVAKTLTAWAAKKRMLRPNFILGSIKKSQYQDTYSC